VKSACARLLVAFGISVAMNSQASPSDTPLAANSAANHGSSTSVSDDPKHWLEKMADAIKHESYQGVLVFGNSKKWHTLSVYHTMIDGVEHEKILHLTGNPREITRNGSTVTYSQTGQSSVFQDHGSQLLSGVDPDTPTLDEFYRMSIGEGISRIAGHQAVKLLIRPVDEYRFGQNLWLDADSGLLLRSDLLDSNQRVLERYQFAQVQIGDEVTPLESEPALFGDRIEATFNESIPQADDVQPVGWVPGWVPPGYSLTGSRMDPDRGETSMYSDGLTAFTLFVDPVMQDSIPDFSKRWGATCAVVRHQQYGDENMRITVVGELPVAAAKKIASSVRYSSDSSVLQ